ncbi:Protein CBG06834 [Caenorhabditis briggsae]|uniref:C2H2-type domain-containing protein n=2 Tax=Caenorhabditis briggsae TaxID=6238 RepID=A0AAE9IS79_CAEBR|nr:Protein CBG06834 [Caenorhabditis briggsae]ULU02336.1 hypothetical protein L3Y34_002125 [Caenorhabditis briggsae]CAP27075.1 Protein CBG06834 [Caenorhabditis briggsae]
MSAQLFSSKAHQTTPFSQKKTKFDCDICSKQLSSIYRLNTHRESVHKAPGVYSELGMNKKEARMERAIHKCRICQKEYCRRNSLTIHFREKHGNQPITSEQRTKTTSIRTNVFGGNSTECLLCDEQFMTRGALFKHMNTQHRDELEVAGILCRMSEYEKTTVPQDAKKNKENNSVTSHIPVPASISIWAPILVPTPISVSAPISFRAPISVPAPISAPAPAPPVTQNVVGKQELMIEKIMKKKPLFSVENILKI